jgi:hypothetical protein
MKYLDHPLFKVTAFHQAVSPQAHSLYHSISIKVSMSGIELICKHKQNSLEEPLEFSIILSFFFSFFSFQF